MNMKRALRKISSLSLAVLFGVMSIGAHTGAMPPQLSHSVGAMDHGLNSTSSSCMAICNPALQQKDEFTDQIDQDDNDKDKEPYYLQFQPLSIEELVKEHDQQTRVAIWHEPPPGLPAYIALSVFRA